MESEFKPLSRTHEGSAAELDEAIRASSRQISSRAIDRIGVRKIRVLSESKLMSLVEKLVDTRMRESELPVLDAIPIDDDDGLPIVILDDSEELIRDEFEELWRMRQREWNDSFDSLEQRMGQIGSRFEYLSSAMREIAELRRRLASG